MQELFFFFLFFFFLFFKFRERKNTSWGGEGRREGEPQAGSQLSAQSPPDTGLEPMNHEIMTRAYQEATLN